MSELWFAESLKMLMKGLAPKGMSAGRQEPTGESASVRVVDSFDWRLARDGGALLEWGEPSHTQRLPVRKSNGGHAASEPLRGTPMQLDPAEIEKLDLTSGQMRSLAPRQLLVMGEGTVSRRSAPLRDHNGKTVAVAEELLVTPAGLPVKSGRAAAAVTVIRPLRGFAPMLRAACSRLSLPPRNEHPQTVLVRTLCEATGRVPLDYAQSLTLPLTPGQTVAEVHQIITDHLLGTCRRNEAGILERTDEEFLHDFRVALRRLRSYIKAVPHQDTANLSGITRELWSLTGRARDLDVLLNRRAAYERLAPQQIVPEIEAVFDRIEIWRDQAYAELSDALRGGATGRLEQALSGVILRSPAEPAQQLARRLTRKAGNKLNGSVSLLVAAYQKAGEGVDDERIHDARIRAKKQRYIGEIFASLGGNESQSPARMKKLQNVLGAYNDLVVEEALFLSILQDRPEELEHLRAAIAYMLAHVEREKDTARHSVMERLEREIS